MNDHLHPLFAEVLNGFAAARPAKLGHPADRDACAKFAREQRARFPSLHGGWTRSQWNHQVAQAAANKLAILTKARREYAGPRQVLRAADLNALEADEAARVSADLACARDMQAGSESERRRFERIAERERPLIPVVVVAVRGLAMVRHLLG